MLFLVDTHFQQHKYLRTTVTPLHFIIHTLSPSSNCITYYSITEGARFVHGVQMYTLSPFPLICNRFTFPLAGKNFVQHLPKKWLTTLEKSVFFFSIRFLFSSYYTLKAHSRDRQPASPQISDNNTAER